MSRLPSLFFSYFELEHNMLWLFGTGSSNLFGNNILQYNFVLEYLRGDRSYILV